MGTRALLLNFAFWTLVGVFVASTWLLSPLAVVYPSPVRLLATALLDAYLWALLTPAVFRFGARVSAERGVRIGRVAAIVAIGLAVGAVVTSVAAGIHAVVLPAPAVERSRASAWGVVGHMGRWYAQQVLAFFGIFVAAVAADMTRRLHAREREAAQLRADASRLQAEQAELQRQRAELQAQFPEARLTVLRTRLNPHFLFNTLNAVSTLITEDPGCGRDMIALLSELLRHALAESTEQEIPLREELRLLRLYLEILEIRYQGQLRSVVTVDADVHDALVPNLVLQPLVENAMKHGIDRAGGHGTIEARGHRAGDDVVLAVIDTGPRGGRAATRNGAGGVGLRLTRERLGELYGDQQRLVLEPATGGGMRAKIVLPYHTRADVRVAGELAPS